MTILIRNFEEKDIAPVLELCSYVRDFHIEILGYALVEKRFPPYLVSPYFNVINIGVNEKAQNLGIGRKLMDAVACAAKEQNVHEIKLGVYNKNINAYKFYEKYGFEPEEQKMVLKF